MRNFVGLPSASVLFEDLPSTSVHSNSSWWLLRLQSLRSAQSTGIEIDWCWPFPLIFGTVGCSNWVINLFTDTRMIH
jgi:hypothetical protein